MVMVNEILASIRDTLESALQAGHARDGDWLRLTNLAGADGRSAGDLDGSIVMSLAAFQADASVGAYQTPRIGAGDGFALASAPLFLDAYVLFVSCFADAGYATGIAALSRIVQYLQEHPVFDGASAPDIGGRFLPDRRLRSCGWKRCCHRNHQQQWLLQIIVSPLQVELDRFFSAQTSFLRRSGAASLPRSCRRQTAAERSAMQYSRWPQWMRRS